MRLELRPLARFLCLRARPGADGRLAGSLGQLEVVAATAGVGPRAAARAAERLLDAEAVDHVVVVGIAGGVGAGSAVGDLVVPERVLDLATGAEHRPAPLGTRAPRGALATADRLIVDPGEIARLERQGVVAIDMETAAIAAVCERRGCAWSVFRAISDRAGDPAVDPAVLGLAGVDGRPDALAVARYLARRPWRVALLARLARDSGRAARAAASAAARALEEAAAG
jgi:nucleoside phosphorylase